MRFPRVFDDKEGAILIAMYEIGNGTFTSYTLARQLNPTVEVGTPPALIRGFPIASTIIRRTTERLVRAGPEAGCSPRRNL
jgi:hypothetical protein